MLDVETGGVTNSAPPSIANKDPEKMQVACINVAKILLGVYSSNMSNSGSLYGFSANNGQDYIENVYNINMKMIWVEGGDFMMGCTSEQGDCYANEKPIRRVMVDGFYIGMLEVTQLQWTIIMGINPSKRKGEDFPVENITWEEAMEFCRKLSKKTGRKYSLPTEAQWEYAARGGKNTEGTKYAGSNNIEEIAWIGNNSNQGTHKCGTKKANELGIFDMTGNVWEWCRDWYSDSYDLYDTNNPTGARDSNGYERVCRGGDYEGEPRTCRICFRGGFANSDYGHDDIGLRVVCIP